VTLKKPTISSLFKLAEITVFDGMGVGLQDLAVASAAA